MATEIFIEGCITCGLNAAYISRVKSHLPDVTVYNTRYDGAAQLTRHIEYLKQAGISVNQYHPIVVENDGERISLLSQWKPSL